MFLFYEIVASLNEALALDGPLLSCLFGRRYLGLPEKVSAIAASLAHQKDLKLSGLKINKEKSVLEPMQVGQWLGFIIDTINTQFRVPTKKIAKLKNNLDAIISARTATFRWLASSTRGWPYC